MPTKIEISPRTILFIVALILGAWFIFLIRDILYLLFISFIIMAVMRPIVDKLESMKIPRALAILLLYIVFIALVIFTGSVIVPPLVSESVRLASNFPTYIEQITPFFKLNVDTIIAQIAPFGQNVLAVTVGIFSNILSIFTVLVFSFYFLLARNNLGQFIQVFIGKESSERAVLIIDKVEARMGAWVRGQIILCLVIGQASFIGLSLLGVNYALALALIAAILEAVPVIGPNISAIPSILVALTISPGMALVVAGLYFVIQQFENNLLVPTVMRRTVGLPPLASLLALMVGAKLAGIMGAILAVPVLLAIQTIVIELTTKNKAS